MKRDSHWLTFLMVLLLAFTLTSCAKSKTPNRGADKNGNPVPGDPNAGKNTNINGNNTNNNNSTSSLQGNWMTACESDYYWDEDAGDYVSYYYTAKIGVSGSQISEELKYFYDAACTDQWDATENASSAFTLGNQVSGNYELNLTTGLPDVRPFNIVKISGTQIQFGDVYNGRDGSSAATRPSSLSNVIFNKR